MTPFISLSFVFIVSGAALLAVVAYLSRLVRQHRRSLSALLKLSKPSLDPLQLPAYAWPTLSDGGFNRLDYSGTWFGQPVQGAFGMAYDECHAHSFIFKIATDGDVCLEFHLYAQADRGEARLFAENLVEVFRLLLEAAVLCKIEALSAALAEQAQLTLYLQHDLRNLAQWVEWLEADFKNVQDDDTLLRIAKHLRTGAPHAAARARRILDATCTKSSISSKPQSIALATIIRQSAEHAGIAVAIEHDACVWLRRDLLDRTLDNLFANVAPLVRQHQNMVISVTISQKIDKVIARINIPLIAEVVCPEKLFEPFACGRPGGLGLGLYQAHRSLQADGGKLDAQVCEQSICFSLNLPGVESLQPGV